MTSRNSEIPHAIRVFVEGYCVGKSRTHPYESQLVDGIWVMRDAPRKNPRDYRKEEWIAWNCDPAKVDARARRETRGRFFVCAVTESESDQEEAKSAYKRLGYRLLATEPLFRHDLKRIPQASSPAEIAKVTTSDLVGKLAKATRSRPIPESQLGEAAPFRQYVALLDGEVVGWVRSVDAAGSTWCSDLRVVERFRRKGIGRALLAGMLRDDRSRDANGSVLLSSHTGALLYPQLGYRQLGVLSIYAPSKMHRG